MRLGYLVRIIRLKTDLKASRFKHLKFSRSKGLQISKLTEQHSSTAVALQSEGIESVAGKKTKIKLRN